MADDASRAGDRYASADILDWCADTHAPHDAGLAQAFDARGAGLPPIQVGPSEGKSLGLLVKMSGARKIVEVGTLAGYSAVWMARALPADGHLWSFEFDAKHAAVARKNLDAAGIGDRVTVVEGAALDTLASIESEGPFDLVFVDADKKNYPHYGAWAAKHLRPGGLLIGDNAFLFGRLLEDSDEAKAMRAFHEDARAHFDTVCLPTPDGLVLAIKK